MKPIFIMCLSTYNRIAFIQNMCVYTRAFIRRRERIMGKRQNAIQKCKEKVRKDEISRIEHVLNQNRYRQFNALLTISIESSKKVTLCPRCNQ